jgi:hypothetical protein
LFRRQRNQPSGFAFSATSRCYDRAHGPDSRLLVQRSGRSSDWPDWKRHENQLAGFLCASVNSVTGFDPGQGSFCAGVKVTHQNADRRVRAMAICGPGERECKKDTAGELLALAFTPKLNLALKQIISHKGDRTGSWSAMGRSLCKKNQGASRRRCRPKFLRCLGQNSRTVAHSRHPGDQRTNPCLHCLRPPCTPRNCPKQGRREWTEPTVFGAS